MHAFEQLVHARILEGLNAIAPEERADTYVVSLWVDDENDWPFTPVVRVGHNTNAYAAEATTRASDALEARWNFAFYPQNELAVIGDFGLGAEPADPEGVRLRQAWIEEELGMVYVESEDWDGEDIPMPTEDFVELLIRVVQRLHQEGAVEQILGHVVPLVIHELEYYEQIIEQNVRANPAGSVDEFKESFYG